MNLHCFTTIAEFYDRAHPYLMRQEVAHNLLLRLLTALVRDPDRYPEPPYMAIVEKAGEPVAIALQTPPHPLVLSSVAEFMAIDLIATDIQTRGLNITEVNAPIAEAKAFIASWQWLTGQGTTLQRALRLHQLTAVQPQPALNGRLRLATEADRSRLRTWRDAFMSEANPTVTSDPDRWITSQLAHQTAYFWEDEQPVCLVCGYSATERSATINLVYTPPEFRKQGYATASVAALSQRLLDRGFTCCVLFTDLANPTANKIYRAIGYQPICDWHHYRLQR
jgi:predicted GNAT family acetyltransferase